MSSGQEARINEALRRLGEEFRLGMVPAEEYRSRRRLLLETWGERDVTTAPGSSRHRPVKPAVTGGAAAGGPARKSARIIWTGLAGLAVAAAVMYSLQHFQRPGTPPPPNPQPAAATARSAQLAALTQTAGDFVNQNRWGAPETDAFLQQWRWLSQEDRRRARQEPVFRTLRHELAQNIQAESQTGAADPVQAERFERLQRFAEELDAD